MGRVQAVFLDAGGVLQLPDHGMVVAAFAEVGVHVDPGSIDRAHYLGIAAHDEAPTLDEAWARYRMAYARALRTPDARLSAAVSALDRLFSDGEPWTRPAPGAADALAAIVAAKASIVIVSNADGRVARRLAEGGLCQVGPGEHAEVVAILDSTIVGIAKPDVRIFELALESVGAPPPARVLHVGDSVVFDVRAAEAAGIRAVHFDPFRLCDDGGHPHLARLPEVVRLLDAQADAPE